MAEIMVDISSIKIKFGDKWLLADELIEMVKERDKKITELKNTIDKIGKGKGIK